MSQYYGSPLETFCETLLRSKYNVTANEQTYEHRYELQEGEPKLIIILKPNQTTKVIIICFKEFSFISQKQETPAGNEVVKRTKILDFKTARPFHEYLSIEDTRRMKDENHLPFHLRFLDSELDFVINELN